MDLKLEDDDDPGAENGKADRCHCCPYGFHIDTDFVRYCDALLTALYNHHHSPYSPKLAQYRNSNSAASGDGVDYSSSANMIDATSTDSCLVDDHSKIGYCNGNGNDNHQDDCRSPLPPPSEDLADSFISFDSSVHSTTIMMNESVYSESTKPGENCGQQADKHSKDSMDIISNKSPTPSSVMSASISKSVLTRIRDDLAQTLLRVKDLEQQVGQIPELKAQISKLDAERSLLQNKLAVAEETNNISKIAGNRLSMEKFPSLNIAAKMFRDVGTLTNFAPCRISRNVFIQTDLKGKDIKSMNANTKDVSTFTEFPEEEESESLPDNSSVTTRQQYCDNASQTDSDYHTGTDFDSSTQSMVLRLQCEKFCVPLEYGNGSSPPEVPRRQISLAPKIIKSDSGISVEHHRRQMLEETNVGQENHQNNNIILVYPMAQFDSLNLSQSDEGENDYHSGDVVVPQPRSFVAAAASNEIRTALKAINDSLFVRQNENFLFSKSVAIVKKNWFKISSSVDSDYRAVELYLDCLEKYHTKLLDFVVNLADTNGNTAIHYAISYNNFDIVSVLLDSKVCDVNKFNKAGYTATMLVSLAKIENELYRDIVERLFSQADVNLKAKQNGQTALMLAASHGRVEISKILLDCGAAVNLQDNDGSTALMCAAEHGHAEVISMLLSHPDCDPTIEDNEGSTALKIALINGHNDIGILLYTTGTRNFNNRGTNATGQSISNQQSPRQSNHGQNGSYTCSTSSSSSSLSLGHNSGTKIVTCGGLHRKSPHHHHQPHHRRSSVSNSTLKD